jgi:hypothetical protein
VPVADIEEHKLRQRIRELARAIAVEDLGGLALALEQAGAYISQPRLSLAAYRSQWQSGLEQVLNWSDPQRMQYDDRSLATTWLTSYREVGDGARTLLRRLAWQAPEPIPESLLEVADRAIQMRARACGRRWLSWRVGRW